MAAEEIYPEQLPLALTPGIRDQTLQILLNIPNDLILLLDPQGNFLLANEHFLKLSGYQLSEILGKNLSDILPPPLAKARLEVVRRVAESGRPERFEDAGVVGWYDNIVYPVFDTFGAVEKIVVQARDITERKQVEAQLQQSLATIETLLESPMTLAALLDENGEVLLANQALAQRLNMPLGQICGRNIFSLLPAEIGDRRRAYFCQAVQSGQTVRFQDRGLTGYFDHVFNPICDSNGKTRRLAIITRDITELREAEQARQRSEALLQAVVSHAPVALFALDKNGHIILVEGQIASQLGYSSDEVAGKNVFDVLGSDYPEAAAAARKAMTGREAMCTIRLKNGRVFETSIMPKLNSNGDLLEIYGLVREITEQTEMLEKLQQSRHQLEVILGGISDSVTVRDNDLRLIYANDAAAFLKGYTSAREYMERGRPDDNFEIIDADGQPIQLEDYLRQRADSIQGGAPLEIRYRRLGSMHDHWIQMKTAPIRDENGAIQMTVFISSDITEQKRTLDELSRSRNELHQRVTERTAELAAANQDLRNEIELRRQAEDELRAAVTRAEALARIAAHLNAQHDLRAIVQSVCEEARQLSPYQTASVFLYNDKADHLYIAAAQGPGSLKLLQSGPVSHAWYEQLMEDFGSELVVHDAQAYARQPEFQRWIDEGTRTMVVLTMAHAGEFIGALMVSSHEKAYYPSEDDLVLLRGIANLGATSIAKGVLFQQLDEASQRLQEMSRKMIDIQDSERRNLALELHDQVGQMLTSLGLSLEQAELQAQAIERGQGEDLAAELSAARQLARDVLQQVREMSLRLRPAQLDELGLVPALLAHFERFSATSNIHVDFRHSGLYARFPSSIENAVFRMIQESLTNVARYAGVQEVSVRLLADDDLLVAQVRDQGIGFDPDMRLAERASSGLSGMSERITLCGGQLTVESAPGHGTCLTAEFTIAPDNRWTS